jgi:hypothetical protein
VVGGASVKNFMLVFIKAIVGRVSFFDKVTYTIVLASPTALYAFLTFQALKKIDQQTKLLLSWVLVPLITAFFFSLFLPIFAYFRLLFILPGFYLIIAKGLDKLQIKFFKPAVGLVLAINLVFVFLYYLNPDFQREDWRKLSNFLNSQNTVNTLVLFENNNLPAPYIYYDQREVPATGALSTFPAKNDSDIIDLRPLIQKNPKIFLVDYLVDISDPQKLVKKKLEGLDYQVNKTYNFSGLGFVYEYTRSF